MDFITNLKALLKESASPILAHLEEKTISNIAQLAASDSFLNKKMNHMEQLVLDRSGAIDMRAQNVVSEYNEALAYINISKEF